MTDDRFEASGFEDFRRLASDQSLSRYERIGFPNSYREGHESLIFGDIRAKLSNLHLRNQKVLDIGPGCSDIPEMLIQLCQEQGHKLWLIDSEEMLRLLPDSDDVQKIPAMYPQCPDFLRANRGKIDAILCYSVAHYAFVDVGFFSFLDESLALLAPGGQFLLGDIPNVSKRKRFFSSETGQRFHREFMQTGDNIAVDFNTIEHHRIDDSVVMMLLQRSRQAGFDSYLLPQNPDLPMANRREDILITRP